MRADEIDLDLQLARRLARGDFDAVSLLVERYADDVYRFVYNQVGGLPEDTEDIVQETFIAALRAARRFRGNSKLRTWLFSIALHKIADQKRWAARRPQVALQDVHIPLLAEGTLPELALEQTELFQAVRQSLLQLPAHYRTALVLKYVEDIPVREIAQIMHRSEKSVESVLVRARRKLMKVIEDSDVKA